MRLRARRFPANLVPHGNGEPGHEIRRIDVFHRLFHDPYGAGAAPGIDPFGSRGTLIGAEGYGHALILQFPYGNAAAGHPAMISAGMPTGYRMILATLENDDDYEGGTEPNKLHLMWHCIEAWFPSTGIFGLYDGDMTGVSLLPPN